MSRLRKKEDALRADLRKKDAHIQRLSNTLESTTHARTQVAQSAATGDAAPASPGSPATRTARMVGLPRADTVHEPRTVGQPLLFGPTTPGGTTPGPPGTPTPLDGRGSTLRAASPSDLSVSGLKDLRKTTQTQPRPDRPGALGLSPK